MRSNDVVERSRLAGARRRALDEGREPPPEPAPATAPPTDATAASITTTDAPDAAAPAVARGPWFDARAFFLGWLAMVAALIAGASGLLIAAAGFGAAYLLARRSRLANAAVSLVGATLTALLLLTALFVAASVFGT